MASKGELLSDKTKYQQLKENLLKVSASLVKATISSSTISDKIDDHYLINEQKTQISLKAAGISKDIKETSRKLKDEVIPAIDDKINNINKEIARIEEEERREEERRERRASSIRFRW